MLSPSDLVQLPKGQAFALIHGGQLHKIRMPLPNGNSDPMMPESIEAIGRELKAMTGVASQPPRAVTIEGNAQIGHRNCQRGRRCVPAASFLLYLRGQYLTAKSSLNDQCFSLDFGPGYKVHNLALTLGGIKR